MNYYGKGVTQDYQHAAKWFSLAAEQENADAQYYLWRMYHQAEGVPKDSKQAIKWLNLSAKQGYADSQYALGYSYDFGQDVTQDSKLAIKWYNLAAEQGQVDAQYSLGVIYYNGEGVDQDYKQAAKWFNLAAEQGDADAQFYLGFMYDNGKGVPQDYKQAVNWFTLAAEQGDLSSQHNLGLMYKRVGLMYKTGTDVVQNYKQAVKWFTLAAEQGTDREHDELNFFNNKILDWDQKEKEALTVLVNLEESIKKYVTASVSYSSGGDKNLYFKIEHDNLQCDPSKDLDKPSISIWYFNKQAVKMASWCRKLSNSDDRYLQLTPKSDKGAGFVVSAFRNSPSSVAIKTDTENFEMSVKGFTKVWNSLSSKAL